MSEKSHVISTLVEHKPGVLQNVAGLLNRRGFNIDSITVGTSEVEGLARMVFVIKGDEKVLEQVIKQLHKLVDVVKIKDLDPEYVLKRELCLVKVKTGKADARSDNMRISSRQKSLMYVMILFQWRLQAIRTRLIHSWNCLNHSESRK